MLNSDSTAVNPAGSSQRQKSSKRRTLLLAFSAFLVVGALIAGSLLLLDHGASVTTTPLTELTPSNMGKVLGAAKVPVLVFYTNDCGARCAQAEMLLQRSAKEFAGQMLFVKVDLTKSWPSYKPSSLSLGSQVLGLGGFLTDGKTPALIIAMASSVTFLPMIFTPNTQSMPATQDEMDKMIKAVLSNKQHWCSPNGINLKADGWDWCK